MWLRQQVEGAGLIAEATRAAPLGPDFDEAVVRQATRMEVWISTWHEDVDDRTEFRLYRGDQLLRVRPIVGF